MPLTRTALRGALVALLLVAGVLLAWLRPNPFADPTEVRAVFADAGALQLIGAEVRMAGTPVGRVTGKRRVGAVAEVTMELDDAAGTVRRDATAQLRPRLAFEGTAFIDLQPGGPRSAPLGDGVLPLARTTTFTSLDTVLRLADAPTRARVRGTAAGLARALEPGARAAVNRLLGDAPALLRDTAWVTEAAQGPRPAALQRTVTQLATTTSALAARERDLAPLMRDTAATAAALRGRVATGRAALRRTIAALPATAVALRDGGRRLDGTVARLQPVAAALRPGARRLAPTLRTARPLLRDASSALVAARPLVADLRVALPAGRRAATPTRRVLRTTTPTLRTLDATLLPALLRETGLGIPAYRAFLNMFAGGGGASRAFQTPAQGGSTGAGHFMRFGFRFLTGIGLPAAPCTLLERLRPELADAFATAGACTP
ncbi:MlaD family protein [Paraconexibacter algicola]|uniref:Mce/MlaD domain-containing protein n=1 Tax=Paraconexibacter algicola TaxID=2133960 RepID=A0A2T4UBK1_9ACTN|nr:MlaD family protein [Paraconexibacter algicola]PTL54269.1 hypothetical protein C7Y72_21205 [Paraconexibacter algicola]